jgi:hypothetical protein
MVVRLSTEALLSPEVRRIMREWQGQRRAPVKIGPRYSRSGIVTRDLAIETARRGDQVRVRLPDGSVLYFVQGSLTPAEEARVRRGESLFTWT